MLINHSVPNLIDKSSIARLRFPAQEVLHSFNEMKQRKTDAERSMLLGKTYKSKILGNNDKSVVKIIFKDEEGTKQVEATIWAVTDSHVFLMAGVGIPLRCIIRIKT
jgi:hypothetical protein